MVLDEWRVEDFDALVGSPDVKEGVEVNEEIAEEPK